MSRIGGTFFFGVFLAAGLLFLALIGKLAVDTIQSRFWPQVPCEILSSGAGIDPKAGSDDNRYLFEVSFRYQYEGKDFVSSDYSPDSDRFKTINEAEDLQRRYPPEARAICFVDPDHPEEAYLKLRSPWICLFILLPLVFVAIGAGGIYGCWRSPRAAGSGGREAPLSKRASSKVSGTAVGLILFGAFFVIGLVLSYFLLYRPISKSISARSWAEVQCTIIDSRVQRHESDDGSTYSVDILYSYEFGGREYRSNRYEFIGGSSSGYDGKREVVDRYSRGSRQVCYVNPANPSESVLKRDLGLKMLLGLIPLVFLLIGGGGLFGMLFLKDRSGKIPREMPTTSPVVLRPTFGRVGKFLGVICVAVFWNGIVSVFVYQAIKAFERGRPDWFLTLFMVPFVLIGLGLIVAIGYTFLALFIPQAELTLSSSSIPLGGSADLTWKFKGKAGAIRRLRILLEGREEAQYRRGTRTATDKEVFASLVLREVTGRTEMYSGKVHFTVPSNLMHSFEASHNKIVWTLKLKGEIPMMPDIDDEYPMTITPHRPRPTVDLPAMRV